MTDYLMITIFGVPAGQGEEGRKVALVPPNFNDALRTAWVINVRAAVGWGLAHN